MVIYIGEAKDDGTIVLTPYEKTGGGSAIGFGGDGPHRNPYLVTVGKKVMDEAKRIYKPDSKIVNVELFKESPIGPYRVRSGSEVFTSFWFPSVKEAVTVLARFSVSISNLVYTQDGYQLTSEFYAGEK